LLPSEKTMPLLRSTRALLTPAQRAVSVTLTNRVVEANARPEASTDLAADEPTDTAA